jgi:DNA-binding LytR/AlgR family response regulator
MLSRRRILVVEDEILTATELTAAIADADGEVVGPVATVHDGLALLARAEVDGAVLDVGLLDRDVTPVAIALLERGKAVVFHTASHVPAAITEQFGEVAVCPKPTPSNQVVVRLATMLEHAAAPPSPKRVSASSAEASSPPRWP